MRGVVRGGSEGLLCVVEWGERSGDGSGVEWVERSGEGSRVRGVEWGEGSGEGRGVSG